MSNTVYTYLTSTEDQLTAINVGYGCPKGLRCKRYCQSEGYYGGFCWKIVCCCIPKAETVEDVIRLVVLCLVIQAQFVLLVPVKLFTVLALGQQ